MFVVAVPNRWRQVVTGKARRAFRHSVIAGPVKDRAVAQQLAQGWNTMHPAGCLHKPALVKATK